MIRSCILRTLHMLWKVFFLVILMVFGNGNTQNTDLSNLFSSDTACTRSIDKGAGIEITPVRYSHRFQVTTILQNYPFKEEFSDIGSETSVRFAGVFETEILNTFTTHISSNDYDAVVFLFLPNGETTQIETVVSSNDTSLRKTEVEGVMRRLATSSVPIEFRNLEATVMEEVQYCLQEIFNPVDGTLTWPTTSVQMQTDTVELCLEGTEYAGEVALGTRQCLPSCITDPQNQGRMLCHAGWQAVQCNDCFDTSVNAQLAQLEKLIKEPNADILAICQFALDETSTAQGLNEMGIESIVKITEFIKDFPPVPEEQLNCTTQLIGNILLLSDDIIAQTEESSAGAGRLLKVLDDILLSARIEDDKLAIVTPSLAVGLVDINVMSTTDQWYGFGSYTNDGLLTNGFTGVAEPSQLVDWTGGKDTYIYVLIDQEDSTTSRVAFTLHQNDKFYQQSLVAEANGFFVTRLNSRIISVSTHDTIAQPIINVAFKMVDEDGTDQSCASWVAAGPDGVFGHWSQDGCVMDSITDNNLTICTCDHLGSFALLARLQYRLSPDEPTPPSPMAIFVIIAAALCFIAFTLVALVFVIVSTLRIQRELQILSLLFFDLALFYLAFAIAINRRTLQDGCLVGAAFMYFCLLAAFAWMAVSAGNSYEFSRQKYIQVKWFVRKAALLAFGIPAGLAIMLVVTNPYTFFDTRSVCFVAGSPTYIMGAALIAPLAISILITIILFIASFTTFPELASLESQLSSPRIQRLNIRKKRLYMTALAFAAIFITFIFLLLSIYLNSIATQVIFAIIAVVQAAFIVWVYLYHDEEIKSAMIDMTKRNKKPDEEQEPSKSNSYWSSTKWEQNGTAGSEVPSEEQQPTRFLGEAERSTKLTRQTFDPNSIPMTELEKKRLKVKVNKGGIKEAKILTNLPAQDTDVSTGFSMQVALDGNGFVNGNGHMGNGNGMVNRGMEYDTEDYEDEANFVTADLMDEHEV